MKHMKKFESRKIGKLAKQLCKELLKLEVKYYDEESWGPTHDLYAEDYQELLEVRDFLVEWLN